MFLRLFLAIAVPPEVRDAIARAQGQLQRLSPPGAVRWTRPDQFHVTLKFLGDVPESEVPALSKNAAEVCGAFSTLQVSAKSIDFFPNPRKPRVVWAGAEDREMQLPEIYRRLSEALRWLGSAERVERFSGHITLGRFKPGHFHLGKLLERAGTFHDRQFGDWLAGEVELVRSELSPTGATHEVMQSFPFERLSAGEPATELPPRQ
ncbi:MAG TPA: RNA 2',3'-cyclic phosphodiesterase [Verrucomicrobiae bacterium]